jgi:hypothetical protein
MLDVTYYIENKYGIERKYPVSPWAKRFCWIAGTKTLGDDLIRNLQRWDDVQLQEVLRKESAGC